MIGTLGTLYTFITVDREGREQLYLRPLDWRDPVATMAPIITTDRAEADRLFRRIEHLVASDGRRVELVGFSERLTIEVIDMRGDGPAPLNGADRVR